MSTVLVAFNTSLPELNFQQNGRLLTCTSLGTSHAGGLMDFIFLLDRNWAF